MGKRRPSLSQDLLGEGISCGDVRRRVCSVLPGPRFFICEMGLLQSFSRAEARGRGGVRVCPVALLSPRSTLKPCSL